jgi:hypothetical protein
MIAILVDETPYILVDHFLQTFVSLHIEWTKFSNIPEHHILIFIGVIALTFVQKFNPQLERVYTYRINKAILFM